MKIEQTQWNKENGWVGNSPGTQGLNPNLVMIFGSTDIIAEKSSFSEIQDAYPDAVYIGCSTAGEIFDTTVSDDTLTCTAIEFEKTTVKLASLTIDQAENSAQVGRELSGLLEKDKLKHVFVISDGLNVNGSDLVKGITEGLPDNVSITGGLSGDGDRFQNTYIISNNDSATKQVTALGFYGDIHVGYGSLGGWDSFGPKRIITKSSGNELFEVDGKSVLSLYKEYLGEAAKGLPATGLLFPLSIASQGSEPVVRTILSVDEEKGSLIFAGDVPEGFEAQFMKANFNRLVDGANGAAKSSVSGLGGHTPELAVLISCVGRKLVLKQRVEEEVESVRQVVGDAAVITGFYSYGEISPFTPNATCELHNQTMTITTFSEL